MFKYAYSNVSSEFSRKSSIASFYLGGSTKQKNGVSHIADDVKCRLRRITHSNNITELYVAINDLQNWEFFQGKLKEGLLELKILFL